MSRNIGSELAIFLEIIIEEDPKSHMGSSLLNIPADLLVFFGIELAIFYGIFLSLTALSLAEGQAILNFCFLLCV